MKRSRTAVLLLMGAMPLALTACSGDEEATREGLYTSVDACVAQTQDRVTCEQAANKAKQDATEKGPRYATREECAAGGYDWDRCEERRDSSGHSFFGPMMTGFFLSQMLRNGSPMAGFTGSPAFRDANGQWKRPDPGSSSGYAGAGVYRSGASPAMVPVTSAPDRAVTVSRGGFGGARGGS